MMTGNKGGGDIEVCDTRRTYQVGATHLMVSLTPAEALTHLLPGHAGVGAGVVGLVTNVYAVLVGVITSRPRGGVTGRGLGHPLTFTADYITIQVSGAGLPGIKAALLIFIIVVVVGVAVVAAVTYVILPDNALIPAHSPILLSVVAGVEVEVGGKTAPNSSHHQHQRDY